MNALECIERGIMRDASTIITEGVEMMKNMTDEELIKFKSDVLHSQVVLKDGDPLVQLMIKSRINNEFIRRGLKSKII